jgi:hypothetical protein
MVYSLPCRHRNLDLTWTSSHLQGHLSCNNHSLTQLYCGGQFYWWRKQEYIIIWKLRSGSLWLGKISRSVITRINICKTITMETHFMQSTGNRNHQNKLLIDICFFYRYRIDDLASEKMFMLDLSFYVCMEESRPSDCIVDIPILKNLKMPKVGPYSSSKYTIRE